jgi:ornithine carbamoyltransferase
MEYKNSKFKKDFIDISTVDSKELRLIINCAKKLKSLDAKVVSKLLNLKNLAMIFEKKSTRTRVSFEVGINQLGGSALIIDKSSTHLGKGESVSDTAKVLSGMVDVIMIRCKNHDFLTKMAQNSTVPVINGLTDYSHPCQIMASILTIEEHFDESIKGKKLSWFGDANNVLNSYINASLKFGYELNIAIPKNFNFCDSEIEKALKQNAKINIFHDPKMAAMNSDVLITDTWFSMGDKSAADNGEKQKKIDSLMPYQVNQDLINLANKDVIFTHCLPAYRDLEVTSEVIDSNKSVVFKEANNRLHVQKAILLWLFDIKI